MDSLSRELFSSPAVDIFLHMVIVLVLGRASYMRGASVCESIPVSSEGGPENMMRCLYGVLVCAKYVPSDIIFNGASMSP